MDAQTNDLLERLAALEARLAAVEDTISRKPDPAAASDGSSVLLAEFGALGDLYRDADARIQATVNLYMAIWATIAGALVVYYTYVEGMRPLLLGLAVAETLLGGMGVLVSRRMAMRAALGNEYLSRLNRIRQYFAQKNPEIAPYLLAGCPGQPAPSGEAQAAGLSLYAATGSVMILVNLTAALLLGMAGGAFVWLAAPSIPLAGSVAVGVGVLCFFGLQWMAQRTLG